MSAMSRNKGSAFEREVAGKLFDLTGITFRRDLEQVREAEHGDLVAGDPAWPFIIECKRRASGTGCEPAWRDQAYRAAIGTEKHPVVIYRFDRLPIRCHVQLRAAMECISRGKWSAEDQHWIDVSLEGLAYLAREGMA